MAAFMDKILSVCQHEIEDKTYVIEKQEDIQQARSARSKAYFIKVMALLAKTDSIAPDILDIIEAMKNDADDTPAAKRMKDAAISYSNAISNLFD